MALMAGFLTRVIAGTPLALPTTGLTSHQARRTAFAYRASSMGSMTQKCTETVEMMGKSKKCWFIIVFKKNSIRFEGTLHVHTHPNGCEFDMHAGIENRAK